MNRDNYDRVTKVLSIIKDDLDLVRQIKGEEFLEAKADMGTLVHKVCEQYNLFKMGVQEFDEEIVLEPESQEVKDRFYQFRKWVDENVKEVICAEKQVYLDAYKVRGTCDMVAIIKGDKKLSLIDIKNTAQIGPKARLQLAGYQMALEAEKLHCERRIALQLFTDDCKAVEFEAHATDKNLFLNALNLFRHLK